MPIHRRIDPDTMDYVQTDGLPERDTSSASEVVLRLTTRRGSVRLPGLELFGSDLHTIDRNAAGAERRAQAFALAALSPMASRGSVTDLKVDATVVSETGVGAALSLTITWKEAGHQTPLTLTLRF